MGGRSAVAVGGEGRARGVLVSINSDSAEHARRLNTEEAKSVSWGGLTEDDRTAIAGYAEEMGQVEGVDPAGVGEPVFSEDGTAAQVVVPITASDGEEIEGVLTLPLGYRAGTRVPLLLVIHGGPSTPKYDGDAARLWSDVSSGQELLRRVMELPGFGKQKAQIFVALLAKQLGVRPDGWDQAAGDYAEEGSYRSVADVVDATSLEKVRSFKKEAKSRARADASGS